MTAGQSYYRPNAGAWGRGSGAGAGLAVEALRRTLDATTAGAPLGVYVPWGKRQGGVTWTTEPGGADIIVYPLTDALIRAATAEAFGNEPPWIGVLAPQPTESGAADAVFNGTRYDLFETQGVYSVEDARPAPQIEFLYWAKLHDEVGGGRNSLETLASRLGGRLVFPIEGTDPGRERPPFPFQFALNQQLAAGQMDTSAPSLSGVIALSGPLAGPAEPSTGMLLIAAGLAVGAVGVTSILASSRSRTRSTSRSRGKRRR